MIVTLVQAAASIAVAVVGSEIVRKKYPKFHEKVTDKSMKIYAVGEKQVKKFASMAKDAFKDGFTEK